MLTKAKATIEVPVQLPYFVCPHCDYTFAIVAILPKEGSLADVVKADWMNQAACDYCPSCGKKL